MKLFQEYKSIEEEIKIQKKKEVGTYRIIYKDMFEMLISIIKTNLYEIQKVPII